VRVHVDTDLGGDPDDVAALIYLLARPDVELVAVTTVDDPGGRRAGLVAEVLRLAGRTDVPIAAGAETSLTTGGPVGSVLDGTRYWPTPVAARPGRLDVALDLLAESVAGGAVVVGIGPATTLALLGRRSPDALAAAHVVLMGGWVEPPPDGYPQWTAADDYNVTCDPIAATEVRQGAGRLTVVPLAATAQVHLRAGHLHRLRALGPLGRLMASQAEAYRDRGGKAELAAAHDGLPDDLLNFHHDPLAAAVAAGWPGVTVEQMRLRTADTESAAPLERVGTEEADGRDVEVIVGVDGPGFSEHWLTTIEAHR